MKLSIIVPCYNEEKRGSDFLDKLTDFAEQELNDYEILLVNDGSIDGTLSLLNKIKAKKDEKIKILQNETNKGKGYSIESAVPHCNGDYILFIDADGSIAPDQIPLLVKKLKRADVAIGCRYTEEANIKQPLLRRITGFLFNTYVEMLFNLDIKDCLCGFKMFKKEAALKLFDNLIDKRWLFDVEILFKAKKLNYKVETLPIVWEHKEGTKIKPYDPFLFLFKLINLRLKL